VWLQRCSYLELLPALHEQPRRTPHGHKRDTTIITYGTCCPVTFWIGQSSPVAIASFPTCGCMLTTENGCCNGNTLTHMASHQYQLAGLILSAFRMRCSMAIMVQAVDVDGAM
jgi:hypothetical protein